MQRLCFHSLLLCLLLPFSVHAQAHFSVRSGSEVAVQGSSTINRFSCETEAVKGDARWTDLHVPSLTEGKALPFMGQARVEVAALDCGNRIMNKDLRKALQVETHPTITYTIDSVRVATVDTAQRRWVPFVTTGRLRIAGVEHVIEQTFLGRQLDLGDYHVVGQVELKMTDFNVEPPTAMMGLVKAHNRIVVVYNLYVTAAEPFQ